MAHLERRDQSIGGECRVAVEEERETVAEPAEKADIAFRLAQKENKYNDIYY